MAEAKSQKKSKEQKEKEPEKAGNIYAKMVKIMSDIGFIGKERTNNFDNYAYRGIDDALNNLQPALIKNGVAIIPKVVDCKVEGFTTSAGKPSRMALVEVFYDFVDIETKESCVIAVFGEGADRGDKAVNKAMSSALKNAVFQGFCVPITGASIDPEEDSIETGGIIGAIEMFLSTVSEVGELKKFWDQNEKEIAKLKKKQYQEVVKRFTEAKQALQNNNENKGQ